MNFYQIRHALKQQIQSKETQSIFNSAKRHHRTLKEFSTPVEVITFLQKGDPSSASKRSAITSSLIAEFQTGNSQCWGAMLLLAYYPYIIRLRKKLEHVKGCDAYDLNALVLECFFESAGKFPLETQAKLAVVNLTFLTRKLFIKAIKKLSNYSDKERPWFDGAEEVNPAFKPSPEDILLLEEKEKFYSDENIRAWIRKLCMESGKDFSLLEQTKLAGLPLVTYVRKLHPETSKAEFPSLYERYRKKRNRLLSNLKRKVSTKKMSYSKFGRALLIQEVRT